MGGNGDDRRNVVGQLVCSVSDIQKRKVCRGIREGESGKEVVRNLVCSELRCLF